MKPGAVVEFVKAGKGRTAEVLAVPGSGPSGHKTLDLDVGGKVVKDVPHETDGGARGYWREHAAPAHEQPEDIPPPVVPESTDEGRATPGAGDPWE